MWLAARMTPPSFGTCSKPDQRRLVSSSSHGLRSTTASRYQKPIRPSRTLPASLSPGHLSRSLPDSRLVTVQRGVDWGVVVPVKRLDIAKSRLAAYGDEQRRALALAFAADVVVAAALVASVLVVTDDPLAAELLASLGARVV